jgi:replicative DNA helicase
MEVDIAKHRNGPTGVVTFMFDKPSNIITSYANKILDIKAEGV